MKDFVVTLLLLIGVVGCADQFQTCAEKRREQQNKGPNSGLVPICRPDGDYRAVQCYQGSCWCVDRKRGTEILGTRGNSKPTTTDCYSKCILRRHRNLEYNMLGIAVAAIRCGPDGKFQRKQCKQIWCWCVDPDTGGLVPRTMKHASIPLKCPSSQSGKSS